jgi:hypothetical protein
MQVSVIDTHTGDVLATEVFEALEEARNKASYAISQDGNKVRQITFNSVTPGVTPFSHAGPKGYGPEG